MHFKSSKGFTLVELLIVIAIIGLLGSIIIIAAQGAREKARIAKVLRFSSQVHHALGAYAVGIWTFDDVDDGTAKDSSGYGNDGTIEGAQSVAGMIGGALDFDGNDYIAISETSDIMGFTNHKGTISVWIKSNWVITDPNISIISRWGTGAWTGWNLALRKDKGIVFFVSTRTPYDLVRADKFTSMDGKWQHIVGVWDNLNIYLYVDGKLEGTDTISDTFTYDPGTQPVWIGRTNVGLMGEYFLGQIDEVKIYSRALTQAQIKQLYAQGAREKGLLVKK